MADEHARRYEDRVWLAMAPDGMRTLVTIMESGAVVIADDLTADELPQVQRLLSMHTRERLTEERRLWDRVKALGG